MKISSNLLKVDNKKCHTEIRVWQYHYGAFAEQPGRNVDCKSCAPLDIKVDHAQLAIAADFLAERGFDEAAAFLRIVSTPHRIKRRTTRNPGRFMEVF